MKHRWTPRASTGPLAELGPPYVRLRSRDQVADLVAGSIVGRSASAALYVGDRGISEAHAMLSLRGKRLTLLSLRGRLYTGDEQQREVALSEGDRVRLRRSVEVEVEKVHLPAEVTTMGVNERAPRALLGNLCSVVVRSDGSARAVHGYHPCAAAVVRWRPAGWVAHVGDAAPHPIRIDERLILGDNVVRFGVGPVSPERLEATFDPRASHAFPMRVVVRYDTVHLHRADRDSLVISGIGARIIAELAAFGVPTDWEVCAREIWKDGRRRDALRKNWDRHVALIRKKLRESGYPEDLVRPDGTGNVELFVRPDDQVIDQT